MPTESTTSETTPGAPTPVPRTPRAAEPPVVQPPVAPPRAAEPTAVPVAGPAGVPGRAPGAPGESPGGDPPAPAPDLPGESVAAAPPGAGSDHGVAVGHTPLSGRYPTDILQMEGVTLTSPAPRSGAFIRALAGRHKLLVLTHDNPDPDAMASAIGLYTILAARGHDVRIGYGGTIGRAQNKAMVRNLELPIYSVKLLGSMESFDGVLLVDCQPAARYHSLPESVRPVAVFDHHPLLETIVADFVEVRPEVGSTSTIVTQYLLAAHVEIPRLVATALMYGIKTDTGDFSRKVIDWDLTAHQSLFLKIDRQRLAEIERPGLPRNYFVDLRKAMDGATIYGEVLVANIERLENPDIVSEVADLFLRLENVQWVLVLGYHEREMRLSMRTSDPKGHAGRLTRKLVKKLGSGGGHAEMAAAQIPLTHADVEATYEIIQDDLVSSFLKALDQPELGTKLCDQRRRSKSTNYLNQPPSS